MAKELDIRQAIEKPLFRIHRRCQELFLMAGTAFLPEKHWNMLEFETVWGRKINIYRQKFLEIPISAHSTADLPDRYVISFKPSFIEWWHLNRFRRFNSNPLLNIQPTTDSSNFKFDGMIQWSPRERTGVFYHPNSSTALSQTVDLRGFTPVLGFLDRMESLLNEKPIKVTDLICPVYPHPTRLIRLADSAY